MELPQLKNLVMRSLLKLDRVDMYLHTRWHPQNDQLRCVIADSAVKNQSEFRASRKTLMRSGVVALIWIAAATAALVGPTRLDVRDTIPRPTGTHRTGRMSFHWVDFSRSELETRTQQDRRQLLVHLFYPARADQSAPRATYLPDAEDMRGAWGDSLTDRLRSLRAASIEGALPLRGTERFPVIVFSPGGGQKVLTYSVLLEDLASQGYIVAAIEPPYNAPAVRFPNGTLVTRLPESERGWQKPSTLEVFLRNYHERVLHWAMDIKFVLDQLARVNAGRGPLAGRINVERAGAIGHSFGGQAAGTVRLIDSRIRSGVNIDGNEKGTGFEYVVGTDGGTPPFLWIETPYRPPSEKDLQPFGLTMKRWNEMYAEGDRQMESVRGGALRVTIDRDGIDHMDFSDQPFWNESADSVWLEGKRRTLAITRTYVASFFDATLKGRTTALTVIARDAHHRYPEVSTRRFGVYSKN